jgi:hypothetical protein
VNALLQFRPNLGRVFNVGSSLIGAIASIVLGTAVASATVFGIVSAQTDAPADSPASVENPTSTIEYGDN